MGNGMVYPVKGSEEIQSAGEHPRKKGSPRTLIPEGEHKGDKSDPCEGKRSKVGKEASSRSPEMAAGR